jgi:DNA replication protein DnaC
MMRELAPLLADLGTTTELACTKCGANYHVLRMRAPNDGGLCDACTDRERRERERRMRCERATRKTLAAIPERYQWCTFESPELAGRVKDSEAIGAAPLALDADRVALLGVAGIGKTVLSVCMLREWAARLGRRGMFVDAYQLGQARAQHQLGAGEAKPVQDAIHAEALILDDLGAERDTVHSAIPDVLHARHANSRPTIITSGFSMQELSTRYGDGIARRLFEGAAIFEMRQR